MMKEKGEKGIPEPPDKVISVLAIEDHEMIRFAIRSFFHQQSGFRYAGDVSDASSALNIAEAEQPDIILLDHSLDDHNSMELLPSLLGVSKGSKVLILTVSQDSDSLIESIRRGASGVIHKSQNFDSLLLAIETVCGGDMWVDKKIFAKVIESIRKDSRNQVPDEDKLRIDSLSDRERQVIDLLAQGLKNKEIADRLFISSTTVRHHLTNIFNKLGVDDRVELIIYAFRHGLAKPPAPSPQ